LEVFFAVADVVDEVVKQHLAAPVAISDAVVRLGRFEFSGLSNAPESQRVQSILVNTSTQSGAQLQQDRVNAANPAAARCPSRSRGRECRAGFYAHLPCTTTSPVPVVAGRQTGSNSCDTNASDNEEPYMTRIASDLRVVYAGQPGTARATSYERFLKARFEAVTVASKSDLGGLDLSGADVLIVDGEPMSGGAKLPSGLTLDDFPLPTVLVGGSGGGVGDALGLKLGWNFGCLCMNHQAIVTPEMRTHAIFAGPFEVPAFETTDTPSPTNFFHYAKVKDVPATVPTLGIHAPRPGPDETREQLDAARAAGGGEAVMTLLNELPTPGLVTTSAGFTDSPDCEAILGGINMKSHDYIAVGRHGRFLQWGFHEDPDSMTEVGRALLANAIHYITGFAGVPCEALRVQHPREFLRVSFAFLDDQRVSGLSGKFGGTVPAGIGETAESALAWYDAHRGYLRHVGSGRRTRYEVDADLVELGIGNDDPALLDRLAADLDDTGVDGERARRLWQRYLRRDATDAVAERSWLAEHRGVLFFSDWAGYRWISRHDLPTLRPPKADIVTEGPVRAWMTAHKGAKSTFVAEVALQVEPGFYLYAAGSTDGLPVEFSVPADSSFTLAGEPIFPVTADGHLTGRSLVEVPLTGDGHDLAIDVRVQACDEQQCTPPYTLTLRCTVTTE